jgi:hypothetical protein
MFKKSIACSEQPMGSSATYQKLLDQKNLLEYELRCIKTSHPQLFKSGEFIGPKIIFAFLRPSESNKTALVTTPFLSFELFQWLLGLTWLGGCSMGLSIAASIAGGLFFSCVSFALFCMSIMCIFVFAFSYLDAGNPELHQEQEILELAKEDIVPAAPLVQDKQVDSFKELLQTYRETRTINRGRVAHDS